eukprot:s146_g9.t1
MKKNVLERRPEVHVHVEVHVLFQSSQRRSQSCTFDRRARDPSAVPFDVCGGRREGRQSIWGLQGPACARAALVTRWIRQCLREYDWGIPSGYFT